MMQKVYNEHYDPHFSRNAALMTDFLDKHYFRSELIGFEELPERNNPNAPLIYISNHSGMAFPWDGIIFAAKLLMHCNFELKNAFRPLSAPMLSKSVLSNPFMVKEMWKKVGCIDATFDNFEAMMGYKDSNVLVYPEGVPGISKGFNNKYQLQRFSSSCVYMAIKHQTNIVPVMSVGAEYINPCSYKSEMLNKLVNKIGVLFLPITPILILLVLQPWIFYMAFPAKLRFVRLATIDYKTLSDKNADELTKPELQAIAETLRQKVQLQLNETVKKYENEPFEFKNLLKTLFSNKKHLPFLTCAGWALLFAEFEYQQKRGKVIEFDKLNFWSIFRIIAHSPLVLCYYIPIFGWIPLLIKGYKGNKL